MLLARVDADVFAAHAHSACHPTRRGAVCRGTSTRYSRNVAECNQPRMFTCSVEGLWGIDYIAAISRNCWQGLGRLNPLPFSVVAIDCCPRDTKATATREWRDDRHIFWTEIPGFTRSGVLIHNKWIKFLYITVMMHFLRTLCRLNNTDAGVYASEVAKGPSQGRRPPLRLCSPWAPLSSVNIWVNCLLKFDSVSFLHVIVIFVLENA